jgi:hypothetical protein
MHDDLQAAFAASTKRNQVIAGSAGPAVRALEPAPIVGRAGRQEDQHPLAADR